MKNNIQTTFISRAVGLMSVSWTKEIGSGPGSMEPKIGPTVMKMELGFMGPMMGSMKPEPWSTKMGSIMDLESMGPEPWSTENTVRLLKLGSIELLGSMGWGP